MTRNAVHPVSLSHIPAHWSTHMLPRRQTTLLAIGAIAAAASLAACGSPITHYTTWNSLARLTSTTPGGVSNLKLAGPLLDAQGKPIPNSAFTETCTQIGPIGAPAPAYRCLAVVNTGARQYVAGGDVAGPYGKLPSLATPATLGKITITNVTTPGGKAQQISISASQTLNGNDDRLAKR
jgi:hypothetical protein